MRLAPSASTLLLAATLPIARAAAQHRPLGAFAADTDVGAPSRRGSASYDAARQRYTVAGAGRNMWGDRDELHFVYRRLTGDFILTTRARLLGKGKEPHRKLGWTVRSTLDAGSPQVTAVVHGDGLAALQWRRAPGAATEEARSPASGADVIQLERRGGAFIMSVARFGDTLTTTQVSDVALGDTVYVGLFVCAHDENVVERGVFDDVRITIPAPASLVPYRQYLASDLETMDVATGERRIVFHAPGSIQAPNWTRDGKALVYNGDGKLYRFDLATRTPAAINTGFATNNNNDHVLSFDGRMLAISNHSASDSGHSIVYTVPLRGGTPKRVTASGPSYLHGWSPDGKLLVYVGERGGEYDIYRIPAGGGEEERLTTTPGLDDGPEYSPDGRWIYFNSVRSGTMQLWRMKPDGSGAEQLTSDGFNNWFPHVSPDGKWIVFISFPPEVSPSDHPFYKHVMLRLMPASGGTPRAIAYLYGGQGTINVPSWSPDSKKIAFVSNSGEQ
ncbi:MAG: TolB family protein [Gemmatimonadaceae bacterium]|nr:TolB family protein [Gemmatimonadaceae bacterium]NUQ94867.1 TolB family protein [Gemmatimonadaceae bacterium]NUR21193.1 TolB family protein [Gemmatimonadaceae bacterium]NUS99324.1 TolB family protein [Gemmatimonadaceae bacterium]